MSMSVVLVTLMLFSSPSTKCTFTPSRSTSVASSVISKLEDGGYVTRTRSREDNRVVLVEPTAAGRQLAQATPLGGIALLRRRLPTLEPERLARLNAALADIMELMEVPESE